MNRVMQRSGKAAGAHTRARATYLMGGGSWSIPCNVFDHKPSPRRSQVTHS